MEFKIFISSRNNDQIQIGKGNGDTLSEIRLFLKKELEDVKFFEKDFLKIQINEEFGADTSLNSYNLCLEEARSSDLVIALYNGVAGWAPKGIDLGICHAELASALDVSSRKTAIIDISDYFKIIPISPDETTRNKIYSEFIGTLNSFTNPLKIPVAHKNIDGFKNYLLKTIKNVIHNHLSDRIKLSNIYYNLSGNNKTSLDWKKLKYSERNDKIITILKKLIINSPNFSKFITKPFSIPDNMSVEDAKSFTGRPFLLDHELITTVKTAQLGPIHFIGVYGSATEIQVKNLIGFPDISAIRDDFGIYVWEQNTHVQLVFLTDCKNPEAIKSNFILFNNWGDSTGEFENIKKRAKARFHILQSINEAKKIASLK